MITPATDRERFDMECVTREELNHEPWNGFRFNMDDSPDWCEEFDDFDGRERMTVWVDAMTSRRGMQVRGWKIAAIFAQSGECECPQCQGDKVIENEDATEDYHPEMVECPYCEGGGYLYLGEFAQVVFERRGSRTVNWREGRAPRL